MNEPFAVLDRHQYMSLTTFRKNGQPVPTPVWFAQVGDKLYVFSEASAGKIKRIGHTPRVTVAPCTMRGELRGETVNGVARVLTDPAERKRAADALTRKYGLQMRLLTFVNRLFGSTDAQRTYIEIGPS